MHAQPCAGSLIHRSSQLFGFELANSRAPTSSTRYWICTAPSCQDTALPFQGQTTKPRAMGVFAKPCAGSFVHQSSPLFDVDWDDGSAPTS